MYIDRGYSPYMLLSRLFLYIVSPLRLKSCHSEALNNVDDARLMHIMNRLVKISSLLHLLLPKRRYVAESR